MLPLRVGFIPDTFPEAGLGHAMRCLAIAQGLLEIEGPKPLIFCESVSIEEVFTKEGVETVACDMAIENIVQVAIREKISLLVLDSYALDERLYLNLRYKLSTIPVLAIDDGGEKLEFPVFGLISFNPGTDFSLYPKEVSEFSAIGSEYYPLRRGVTNGWKPKKIDGGSPKSLLVTMGGSDPDRQTLRIVRLLRSVPGYKRIIVVVGPANQDYEEIATQAFQDKRIRVVRDTCDFVKLMSEADAAVCGGGVTLAELLALGIPVAILALAGNLELFAQAAEDACVGLFIGRFDIASDHDILLKLHSLAHDLQLYANLLQSRGNLIDRNGRLRLAKFLTDLSVWYHNDTYSEKMIFAEYEASSRSKEEHEKLKWGSRRGMLYRFRLTVEQINWSLVDSWCDVGCGTGSLLQQVPVRKMEHFLGVDLSSSLLGIAAETAPDYMNATFVPGNFLNPLPGEPFDLVTCLGVLQKSGVNLFKAMARLAQITAPGGQLIITTKNLDWERFKEDGFDPEPGHHWFHLQDIRLSCKLAGLEIIELIGFIPDEKQITRPEEAHSVLISARRKRVCG